MTRMIRCAAALAALTTAAPAAQTATSATFTSSLTTAWNREKQNVAGSASAMPEADYGFKPIAGVRTFGEILGHLANEHYMFCSQVKGEKNPQDSVDFEKITAKADMVKAIASSIAYCDAVYASVKDDARALQPSPGRRDNPYSTLLLNVTHDGEHYGNLVTYLRMKGIVPPSSKP
jgi:uncharacterized damage-inducible protein DinB